MALLIDIFGFLSVLLHGIVLAALCLTIGGITFLLLLARPLAREQRNIGEPLLRRCRFLLGGSALILAFAELLGVALQTTVLVGTLDIAPVMALGANFAGFGLVAAAAALATALLARRPLDTGGIMLMAVLALAMLLAQLGTSHAAARLDDRVPLALAYLLHILAASVWIGGIPYFLIALNGAEGGNAYRRIGRRFSAMAMSAVALLLAGGIGMAIPYIGSLDAIYGTAYGVMVSTKTALLAFLLFLGGMNYLVVERLRRDPRTPILRLRRFAEVEIGIGFTVLFAAASLTSLPPAADLAADRVGLHEIVERLTPQWPRLESPEHNSLAMSELQAHLAATGSSSAPAAQAYIPGDGAPAPRNAEDIAWSEYNHHWAGILVLAMGLLALLERTGRARWARHWPLLFLLLGAFLFVRSDPEVWPLGTVGLIESLRDPEVVQHRIFVVLIAGFALFEWCVRTGRLRRPGAALVFPLISALGGALLLTHSHALANVKDQLLIEMTHVPLALFGITAGWGRWLELRLDERGSRIAAWVWPVAFVLVGLVLLLYREA